MTLLLSNQDLEALLGMPACMATLEEAYRDQAEERVLSLPRQDNLMPCGREEAYYAFKTMGAAWPRSGLMALRLNSDIVTYERSTAGLKRRKLPLAHGRWVGLVQLFSLETGELLAIFPDGVVQRLRVGATNGLGLRLLARSEASRLALIGSGWQAGAQLLAASSLLPLERVQVYSPSRDRLERFVAEQRQLLGIDLLAAGSPADCVRGADVIMAATSSMAPVIQPEWIRPGVHISCIKPQEIGLESLNRCTRVAVHTHRGKSPDNVLPGTPNVPQALTQGWWREPGTTYADFPELCDLLLYEKHRRNGPGEATCFVNNFGLGLQFTALGALALREAQARKAGQELPGEWFSQDVHP